jgi:hypothetical protein
LFDFAIAGPLAGLAVSICLLFGGLEMTSAMEFNAELPVVPVDLLRASSLAGEMTQFFLGKGAVMPEQGPMAVVALHPFAIAGFIGCMTNSLALLPLGRKYIKIFTSLSKLSLSFKANLPLPMLMESLLHPSQS